MWRSKKVALKKLIDEKKDVIKTCKAYGEAAKTIYEPEEVKVQQICDFLHTFDKSPNTHSPNTPSHADLEKLFRQRVVAIKQTAKHRKLHDELVHKTADAEALVECSVEMEADLDQKIAELTERIGVEAKGAPIPEA